jgi:hypothetical protein
MNDVYSALIARLDPCDPRRQDLIDLLDELSGVDHARVAEVLTRAYEHHTHWFHLSRPLIDPVTGETYPPPFQTLRLQQARSRRIRVRLERTVEEAMALLPAVEQVLRPYREFLTHLQHDPVFGDAALAGLRRSSPKAEIPTIYADLEVAGVTSAEVRKNLLRALGILESVEESTPRQYR